MTIHHSWLIDFEGIFFLAQQREHTCLSLNGKIGLTAWKLLFAANARVMVGTSGISRGLHVITYQRIPSTQSEK